MSNEEDLESILHELKNRLISSPSSIVEGGEAILKYNGQVYINPIFDIPLNWILVKISLEEDKIKKLMNREIKPENNIFSQIPEVNAFINYFLPKFDNIFFIVPPRNSISAYKMFKNMAILMANINREPVIHDFYMFMKPDQDMEVLFFLISKL